MCNWSPRRRGDKKGLEQLSKEIMAEILINLMKTINSNQENKENHIEADQNQISEKKRQF